MGIFTSIFAAIFAGFMLWMLFKIIKERPELFSAANMNKSFMTMGVLALLLIGAVSFVIAML